MNQKIIRITALILAILMAGGVLIVAFTNIAAAADETSAAVETVTADTEQADGISPDTAPLFGAAAPEEDAAQAPAAAMLTAPATGTDGVPKAPVIIGIVAVLLAVACVVVPKIAKK